MSYAIYVNPGLRYARVHMTCCGEWTEGRYEYPGGFWRGPYDRFRDAIIEAENTEYPVIVCNLSKKFIHGMSIDRQPGPKAEDLHFLDLGGHAFREIYVHPRIDVVLEKDVYGDSLVLHRYDS